MVQSQFVIQVVDRETGDVVEWAPGLKVEKDFVNELCERVAGKGVGVGRTTRHVVADVRVALQELLYTLKANVSSR